MGILSVSAGARRWHRRLSLLAGFALILWAGSGLLHPVMSWTNPRPVAFAPPVGAPLPLPAVALAQVAAGPIKFARLIEQDGRSLWQVRTEGRIVPDYYDAGSGEALPDADRARALWLARFYTGRERALEAVQLTVFDLDYPEINRLLPVWCVSFEGDDALTACVHTGEDRLATLNDRRKRLLQALFQTVHTLSFLDRFEGLRLGFVLAAVGSVLAMAMLGGVLLMGRRVQGDAAPRRTHRRLAWAVWLPVLMLSASGLFHLSVQTPLRPPPVADPTGHALDPQRLAALPANLAGARSLSLLALEQGAAVWRAQFSPQDLRVHDALDGRSIEGGDAMIARRLAGAGADAAASRVTSFSYEYAFASKRLPVWRVQTPQGLLFVDAANGLIAARADRLAAVEQWSFSTLHKWQFLDPLGRVTRDILLSLSALLALATAVAGLRLLRRQRTSSLSA